MPLSYMKRILFFLVILLSLSDCILTESNIMLTGESAYNWLRGNVSLFKSNLQLLEILKGFKEEKLSLCEDSVLAENQLDLKCLKNESLVTYWVKSQRCSQIVVVPDGDFALSSDCRSVTKVQKNDTWNFVAFDSFICQSVNVSLINTELHFEFCDDQANQGLCQEKSIWRRWFSINGNRVFSETFSVKVLDDLDNFNNFDCGSQYCQSHCANSRCEGDDSFCDNFGPCELSECYCKVKDAVRSSNFKVTYDDKWVNVDCHGNSFVLAKIKNKHAKIHKKEEVKDVQITCNEAGMSISATENFIRFVKVCKQDLCISRENVPGRFFLPSYIRGEVEVTFYLSKKLGKLSQKAYCPNVDPCENVKESGFAYDIRCKHINISNILDSLNPTSMTFSFFAVISVLILTICLKGHKIILRKNLLPRFRRSQKQKLEEEHSLLPTFRRRSLRSSNYSRLRSLTILSALSAKKVDALPLGFEKLHSGLDVLFALVLLAIILYVIKSLLQIRKMVSKFKCFSSIIVILIFVFLFRLVSSETACGESFSMSLKEEDCDRDGFTEYCKFSSKLLLKVDKRGDNVCFSVLDKGQIAWNLNVETKHIGAQCDQVELYHTYEPVVQCHSFKNCPKSGHCNGEVCDVFNTKKFDQNIFPEFKNVLQKHQCSASCGCAGCGCFFCWSGCLFKTAGLTNPLKKTYKVVKCSSWKIFASGTIRSPRFKKEFELHSGNKFKADGITMEILSENSPPLPLEKCFLIYGDEAALVTCNDKDELSKGKIGEIQCRDQKSAAKANLNSCVFNQDIVSFVDSVEKTTCENEITPVSKIFAANLLPKQFGFLDLYFRDGHLTADFMSDFSFTYAITAKEVDIKRVVTKVKCQIQFQRCGGCFSCLSQAFMVVKASCDSEVSCYLSCPTLKSVSSIQVTEEFSEHNITFSSMKEVLDEECYMLCNSEKKIFTLKGKLNYDPAYVDFDRDDSMISEGNSTSQAWYFPKLFDFQMFRTITWALWVAFALIVTFLMLKMFLFCYRLRKLKFKRV